MLNEPTDLDPSALSSSFEIEQDWTEGLSHRVVKSDPAGNLEIVQSGMVIFTVIFQGNWSIDEKRLVANCVMDRNVSVAAQSHVVICCHSLSGIKAMLNRGASRRCVSRCLQRYGRITDTDRTLEELFDEFCQYASIDESEESDPSNFESYLEMIEMVGREFTNRYIQEPHRAEQEQMVRATNDLVYVRDGAYRRIDFSKVSADTFHLLAGTYPAVAPNRAMIRFVESVTDDSNDKSDVLHKRYRSVEWVMPNDADADLVERFFSSLTELVLTLSPIYRNAVTPFHISHLMCLMMAHFGVKNLMDAWDCVSARPEVNTKNIISDICLVAEYASNGGNVNIPFDWIKEIA